MSDNKKSLDFRRKTRVSRRARVIDSCVLSQALKRLHRSLPSRKRANAFFIINLVQAKFCTKNNNPTTNVFHSKSRVAGLYTRRYQHLAENAQCWLLV